MTTLKIKVTRDILAKSIQCGVGDNWTPNMYRSNCAIALAVRDIFPNAHVGNYSIFHNGDNEWNNEGGISLPFNAQKFILNFDELRHTPERRTDLPELEFSIEVPDDVIDEISIDEIRPLLYNHPTLELIEAEPMAFAD